MEHFKINEAAFDKFPTLKSKRLKLRTFKKKDAKDFHLLRSNPTVMEYMNSPFTKNKKVAFQKIKAIQQDFKEQKGINWSIVDSTTGEWIGYFGIWRIDKTNCRGEIGYALKPEYWGRGYMTEAFEAILDFSFKTLHLHSLEANVNPSNKNSIQLLKKIGFRQEAYFREDYLFEGRFLDSAIYSLIVGDWLPKVYF